MKKSLTVALNYKCNNDCGFCFLRKERGLGWPDMDRGELDRLFAGNAADGRYSRLIFSGAEATLCGDLPRLAALALERGGFSSVTLQTNGRRLSDPGYCRELVAAGVSEFQVSVQAHSGGLDARITGAKQNFRQMREGLRNIRRSGAALVSSTVVTRQNYAHLPEIAAFLSSEELASCRFWNFRELGAAGQTGCHARLSRSVPRLLEAAEVLLKGGAAVSLSWFPRCMLGKYAGLLEDYSSPVVIRPEFKSRLSGMNRYGCRYSGRCAHFGKKCQGLSGRYLEIFGDERALLSPAPKKSRRAGGKAEAL